VVSAEPRADRPDLARKSDARRSADAGFWRRLI